MQNAFIESFNGRLRDELLNEMLFTSLTQARVALGCWRADYNEARLHSLLGWKTPSEFAFTCHPRRELALHYARAPRQLPPLPPPDRANPTAVTNSGLDKTWRQGQAPPRAVQNQTPPSLRDASPNRLESDLALRAPHHLAFWCFSADLDGKT